ncbi:MAG: RNA polymerase sigma factor [Bacteroidia bacterium]|nr:RNA polymerase sigma factor [Bacteroidia bacterium]
MGAGFTGSLLQVMDSALAEILKQCKEKNEKAQFSLYKKLFSLMMSICLRYRQNHDDALALVNHSFFKILSNLDKYDVSKPFDAWVRRIVINTVIDSFRKNKSRLQNVELVDFSENTSLQAAKVVNEVEEIIEEEHLQNMLNQLPDATKAVFNLYAIDGYTHREISKKLEISIGTSKWHVSQARRVLKELLIKFQEHVSSFILL